MTEVIGLPTARDVWCAFESAYSHDSVERMQNLKPLGFSSSIAKRHLFYFEYGHKFKGIYDQLATIGHLVDDVDKKHWFICGLGSSFKTFSTAIQTVKPRPSFRDLISQDDKLVHGFLSSLATAAFMVESGRSFSSNQQFPSHAGHDVRSGGRGRVFHAKCNVHDNSSNWFIDFEASTHMASSSAPLDSSMSYTSNDHVIVGNGNILNISRIGNIYITKNIDLLDVLVVPKLTKNLLSISK
ncbi:zinc finger, CCHC-type containing LTR copia-type gag-polypeptide [Tanacetum coccineum]